MPGLRSMDREYNAEAATQQHSGIERTEWLVEMVAGLSPGRGIQHAIDRICRKQHTEEQHLSRQKDPHAEAIGLMLLVEVVELVCHQPMLPGGVWERNVAF